MNIDELEVDGLKCPIDTTVDLLMTERSGIEIDYCPECRGVWLDRGELDKLIARSDAGDRDDDDDRQRGGHDRERVPQKRKKGSFLGEFFDFG